MRRRQLSIVAVALLLHVPAQAQDWTGWYVGIEAGRTGTDTFSHQVMTSTPATYWPTGIVGGHLWAIDNNFVAGIEAGIGIMNPEATPLPPWITSLSDYRPYASISALVGAPFSKVMPYASAGLQLTAVDLIAIAAPGGAAPGAEVLAGTGVNPMLSLGAEVLVTEAVSLKIEANHIFGSVFLTQTNGATSDFNPGTGVSVGVNFRF